MGIDSHTTLHLTTQSSFSVYYIFSFSIPGSASSSGSFSLIPSPPFFFPSASTFAFSIARSLLSNDSLGQYFFLS